MKWVPHVTLVVVGLIISFLVYTRTTQACRLITLTTPNNKLIKAETARTQVEQIEGLSFRKNLAPDAGMLFLFPKLDIHTFWMKNTFIPLDIIWLHNHTVVEMTQLNPQSEGDIPSYTPKNSADAVLEIPAGQTTQFAITQGSQLFWNDPCPTPSPH